jgi:3-oxoacyl-[acyl-carrier protein] reductase
VDLGIEGKRAAVAASSRGLGFAVARMLAAEGASVAMCGRDRAAIELAAIDIGAVPVVADVSTAEGAAGFVRDARAALGGVDILVPNAGGPPAGGFAEQPDPEAYLRAFELNALSVIAMCAEAVPEMRARRWGRIVAITSLAVRQPNPALILSTTARAGATGFLKTLAREVAADGVTVNSVQPGLHDTERLRQLTGGEPPDTSGIPARRIGEPDELAAVAVFLCSEPAGYVTGAAIPVDGGAYPGLL